MRIGAETERNILRAGPRNVNANQRITIAFRGWHIGRKMRPKFANAIDVTFDKATPQFLRMVRTIDLRIFDAVNQG